MTGQIIDIRPNLFDYAAGMKLRDEGIATVTEATSVWWRDRAAESVRHCANEIGRFTSDDVWAHLAQRGIDSEGVNPKSIGGVFTLVKSEGLIVPTDDFRRTARPEGHRHPIMVWKKAGVV